MEILGIDIGGSSLKGALVNIKTGEINGSIHRIPTPESRKPAEIAESVNQMLEHFNYSGLVGCGFPSIIKNGICKHPGNLHPDWVGVSVDKLFQEATGQAFTMLNDADAAGIAEMRFGAGQNEKGLVVTVTVGTGLGSGAYLNGELIPNFELGQIPYKDFVKIEDWAASSIKTSENLSYEEWGKRFDTFLNYIQRIICPDLLIVGGGISNDWDKFVQHLNQDVRIIPASLRNDSGIIGAAVAAAEKVEY